MFALIQLTMKCTTFLSISCILQNVCFINSKLGSVSYFMRVELWQINLF